MQHPHCQASEPRSPERDRRATPPPQNAPPPIATRRPLGSVSEAVTTCTPSVFLLCTHPSSRRCSDLSQNRSAGAEASLPRADKREDVTCGCLDNRGDEGKQRTGTDAQTRASAYYLTLTFTRLSIRCPRELERPDCLLDFTTVACLFAGPLCQPRPAQFRKWSLCFWLVPAAAKGLRWLWI